MNRVRSLKHLKCDNCGGYIGWQSAGKLENQSEFYCDSCHDNVYSLISKEEKRA